MSKLTAVIALGSALAVTYPYGSLRVDEHRIDDPYTPKRRSKGEKKRNKSARCVK